MFFYMEPRLAMSARGFSVKYIQGLGNLFKVSLSSRLRLVNNVHACQPVTPLAFISQLVQTGAFPTPSRRILNGGVFIVALHRQTLHFVLFSTWIQSWQVTWRYIKPLRDNLWDVRTVATCKGYLQWRYCNCYIQPSLIPYNRAL